MKHSVSKSFLIQCLKAIVLCLGIGGACIYFGVFPYLGLELRTLYPEFKMAFYPWLIFLWCTGVPCYAVLVLLWQFVKSVEKHKPFTLENAERFRKIGVCAMFDAIFFLAGNALLLFLNWNHPSILLLSFVISLGGLAVWVVATLLSLLCKKAAILQADSDLTI